MTFLEKEKLKKTKKNFFLIFNKNFYEAINIKRNIFNN